MRAKNQNLVEFLEIAGFWLTRPWRCEPKASNLMKSEKQVLDEFLKIEKIAGFEVPSPWRYKEIRF